MSSHQFGLIGLLFVHCLLRIDYLNAFVGDLKVEDFQTTLKQLTQPSTPLDLVNSTTLAVQANVSLLTTVDTDAAAHMDTLKFLITEFTVNVNTCGGGGDESKKAAYWPLNDNYFHKL